jgi:glycosyltransferase involved in cell wall biosynthesis
VPRRLKVLISAYACEPNKGSEQGVGWSWVRQMARFHEVWVLTRARRRAAIDQYLARFPDANIHVAYCDLPGWLRFWKSGDRGIHLYYVLWQVLAFLQARRLVRSQGIELAHHVSLMSLPRGTFVSFLGIPSIIGPIGGLQVTPAECLPLIRNRVRERFRTLMVSLVRLNPVLRAVWKKASLIVLANASNSGLIPGRYRGKVITGFQLGTNNIAPKPSRDVSTSNNRLVVHWSGRFVDHKGFGLAIRAAEFLRKRPDVTPEKIRFVVTGSGPEQDDYQRSISALHMGAFFQFTGWLSQQELEDIWAKSDVFLFTSLRETTGMALQEAMMRGIPPIVIDNGGPGEMVTAESGVKIRIAPIDQMAEATAAAIYDLSCNREKRRQLGAAARRRAEALFDWNSVGARMNELYLSVASAPRTVRPDTG